MRRGEWIAVLRREVDRRACCRLRGEPALRLHLEHALSERADDAPTTGVRPESDRETGRDLDPGLDLELRDIAAAVQYECERDHAHRLLRVVGAVRERD